MGSASLLILLALGLHLLLGREAAPYSWWRVTGFDTQVTVHASGAVDMVETVTYDFGDEPSHSLARELPETGWIDGYGWRDFGLTGIRGEGPDGLRWISATTARRATERARPSCAWATSKPIRL
ncbi:DUF2207 domain-containing protein [Nocardiopsis valliformis]|uniref:DUF2207 domain-containing protein n=1 Tax=Nocardiopsis valliformis TaxID=239974 RepID=UPI00308458A6